MAKVKVIGLSGGLDSTSLLLESLASQAEIVFAVSFLYNQKHRREIDCAKNNITYLSNFPSLRRKLYHHVIDLSSAFSLSQSSLVSSGVETPTGHYEDKNMMVTVVENRNAIFASILFGMALSLSKKYNEKVQISLGIHQGDHLIYPDCREESRNALEHAFRVSNWGSENVEYYAPFLDEDKAGVLNSLLNSCSYLGADWKTIVKNTNTCYSPNSLGEACGKCGSCTERLEAFSKLGIRDVVVYQ